MDQSTPPPNKRHRGLGMLETGEVEDNQPAASNAPVHDVDYHSHDENLNKLAFDASGLGIPYNNDAHLRFGRVPIPPEFANIAGSTNNPFPVNSDPVGYMTNAQTHEMLRQIEADQSTQHVNIHHDQQMGQAGMFQSQMSGNGQAVPFANNMDQSQSHNQFLVGDNLNPTTSQMHEQDFVSYDDGQAREGSPFMDSASDASSSDDSSPDSNQDADAFPTYSQPEADPPAVESTEASKTGETKRKYIIVGQVKQKWINDVLDYERSAKTVSAEVFHKKIREIMSKGRVRDYIKIEKPDPYRDNNDDRYLVIEDKEIENLVKAKKRKRDKEDDGTLMVKRRPPILQETVDANESRAEYDVGPLMVRTADMTEEQLKLVHEHNCNVKAAEEAWRKFHNRVSAKNCRINKENKVEQLAEENAILKAKSAFLEALLFCLIGIENTWEQMPEVEREDLIGDYRFNPRDSLGDQ